MASFINANKKLSIVRKRIHLDKNIQDYKIKQFILEHVIRPYEELEQYDHFVYLEDKDIEKLSRIYNNPSMKEKRKCNKQEISLQLLVCCVNQNYHTAQHLYNFICADYFFWSKIEIEQPRFYISIKNNNHLLMKNDVKSIKTVLFLPFIVFHLWLKLA